MHSRVPPCDKRYYKWSSETPSHQGGMPKQHGAGVFLGSDTFTLPRQHMEGSQSGSSSSSSLWEYPKAGEACGGCSMRDTARSARATGLQKPLGHQMDPSDTSQTAKKLELRP
ncbi:unnamed protein product [Eretmochelys imbricata]